MNTEEGTSTDLEETSQTEKLKTSLHYSVGKICQDSESTNGVKFDKTTISVVASLTYQQIGVFAEDLEAFSRHGKRSTINIDDVKLLVRKSEALHNYIDDKAKELSSKTTKEKGRKRKKVVAESDLD